MDFLKPHPSLAFLVKGYIYNEFDIKHSGCASNYYFLPTDKKFISFYLDNTINVTIDEKCQNKSGFLIVGPQTKPVSINFTGKHRIFSIELQNDAFYTLLNKFPVNEIVDCNINGSDIFGTSADELTERLHEISNIIEMKREVELFILRYISKIEANHNKMIFQKIHHNAPIEKLSYQANMSLRNYERKCKEVIGFSPKMFQKISRFTLANKIKQFQPKTSWTEISAICNYFDQMHMIKDFKNLSGYSPTALYRKKFGEVDLEIFKNDNL